MHGSGAEIAAAIVGTTAALDAIRARMVVTVALLDQAIEDRQHLHAVPDRPERTKWRTSLPAKQAS